MKYTRILWQLVIFFVLAAGLTAEAERIAVSFAMTACAIICAFTMMAVSECEAQKEPK
jgi:hypothetical protein